MRALVLIAFLLAPAAALAQTGLMPRSNDDVVLARIYRTTKSGTDPVGRMGLVLGGKSGSRSLGVDAGSGSQRTVTLSADRKGDGARVAWQVAGAGAAKGSGDVVVKPGGLVRMSLGNSEGVELFASVEVGRASQFDMSRLAQHFGAIAPPVASAETVGVAPVLVPSPGGGVAVVPAAALMAAASDRPRGPGLEVPCAGATWALSLDSGRGECRLRVSDDGERVLGGACSDPEQNAAEVSCALDQGRGACVRTAGNGRCARR